MLNHPTLDQLQTLRLFGMHKALSEQLDTADLDHLSFEERLGLLIDREAADRASRRLQYRLRKAKLKQQACIEDIDYRHRRGLDRRLMHKLIAGGYIHESLNVLITGPAGVGKTWLACALAQKVCRDGYGAIYCRLPRLTQELDISRADGRYPKLLRDIAKARLLVLDDWGLTPMASELRRDLLEILDDRHGSGSTIITSQLPIENWHDYIGEPTVADAILDRLVHNAYRINLKGESMRKGQLPLTKDTTQT